MFVTADAIWWQNAYDFIEKQRKAFKAKKKPEEGKPAEEGCQSKGEDSMSRYYEMGVEILGHDPEKEDQIKKAAENEWPFGNWWSSGEGNMQASAQDWLCWRRNRRAVHRAFVRGDLAGQRRLSAKSSVNATYLEELPYETHTLDQEDYDRLIQPNTGETKHEDHVDRGN